MQVFFAFLILLHLLLESTSEKELPGGLLSEAFSLITNGTIENLFGCKTQDRISRKDITYLVYTRPNRSGISLTSENLSMLGLRLDTKILFPGYLQPPDDPPFLDMTDAFLNRYDCNVIIINYYDVLYKQYSQAYCNAFKVAEFIGDFLCKLHRKKYLEFDNLHILGLSIGGQMAGLVGNRVQIACNQIIDRLTGFDPAGPIYQSQEISLRLDESDGKFVDVIHTNMGIFGYYGSMGHVDFFPNCGSVQAGCISRALTKIPNGYAVISEFIGCSHKRGIGLYTESIYGSIFNAISCTSCPNRKSIGICTGPDIVNPKYAIMGEDCPRNLSAKRFVLRTNGKPPFAKH